MASQRAPASPASRTSARVPPSHQQLSTEQLRLRQAVQEPDCSKDSLLTLCCQQGSLPYLTLKVPCLATLAGLALPPRRDFCLVT